MDWSRGFTSSFYATFIDPDSWGDRERFEITGGSVRKSDDSLKQSASINCVNYQNFDEQWIRIWMDCSQEGGGAHEPIFTGLAMNPSKNFHGRYETNSLTCYSVLKPVDDVLLPKGWYIYEGADVKENILDLLKPTKAPIIFDEEPTWLTQTLIAEQGETNLSMVEWILTVIGWRMMPDGYGRIHISPQDIDDNGDVVKIASSFHTTDNDILEMDLSVENDWFGSPNVFRAISGDVMAIAKDEDESSPYSIPSRGREIWMEESDCVLDSEDTLADYAARRLREEQSCTYKISYTRRYEPDVNVYDVVQIHYPEIAVDGLFLITSQTIELGKSAVTSEEAYMVG